MVRGLLKNRRAGTLAREILVPRGCRTSWPAIPASPSRSARASDFVDLVREGFDCVVRAGELTENGLIVVAPPRRLPRDHLRERGLSRAPRHPADAGRPRRPRDDRLRLVAHPAAAAARVPRDGRVIAVTLPARVLVMSADVNAAAVRAGLGLMQAPRHRFAEDLASGALIEGASRLCPGAHPALDRLSEQPPAFRRGSASSSIGWSR